MNRSNHTSDFATKANLPPSALVIFAHGFNKLPVIVPNGGSVELDAQIMQWLEEKLSPQQKPARAA